MKIGTLKLLIGLILFMISNFFLLGCSAGDEKEFKKNAGEMYKIFSELKHVKSEIKKSDTLSNTEKDFFILNFDNKNEFINNKKNEIDMVVKHFEEVIDAYSNSKWADDSSFCLAMLYLTISNPGNDYYNSAINYTKYFLTNFPSFHIEDWTQKKFSEIISFEIVFSKSPDQSNVDSSKISQEESVKINLMRAIVNEYLKAGKPSDAKAELKELKQNIKDKSVISSLEDDISNYDRIQSMMKSKQKK